MIYEPPKRQPFCAVCLSFVTGALRREPLGKDNAMVVVCRECATDAPTGDDLFTKRSDALTAKMDRALKMKARREQNGLDGVCLNARKHGPATHGKLCGKCHAMAQDIYYRHKKKRAA